MSAPISPATYAQIGLSVLDAGSLVLVKEYFLDPSKVSYYVTAIFMYALCPVLIYRCLLYGQGIADTNSLWNAISTLFTLVVGLLYYKETLHNHQIVGVLFTVVGVALIQYAPTK